MIRRAEIKDMPYINMLLGQVLSVHNEGRPDLFRKGTKKYTDEELRLLIRDDNKPIFVYEENGKISGYVFCVFIQRKNDNILTDIKTLVQ